MIDVADFQSEVIEASREQPVLVDFWAPWCGPFRILGPVLEKLAAENGGRWKLAKVNTDEQPTLASRYRISSIPAVKLFVDGEVRAEFIGALPEERVRKWLDEHLPTKTRQRLAEAAAAFDAADQETAVAIADEVLQEEPENPDAMLLLARARVFDTPERARELAREAARARPAHIQSAQAVETVATLIEAAVAADGLPEGAGKEEFARGLRALATGEVDAALAAFVQSIRKDRRYNDDAARKACLALFSVLGERHPLTRKHRRDFDMAVF